MGHLSCNEYYDNIRLNRILRHERNRIARHHNVTPEQLLRRAAYYQPWPDRYATMLRFAAAQKADRRRAILRASSRSERTRHVRDVNNGQNVYDGQLERPVRYEHVLQLGSLRKVDDTESKKVENPEKEQATVDAEPNSQLLNNVDKKEAKKFDGLEKELASTQASASAAAKDPATGDARVDADPSTQREQNKN